MPNTTDNFHLVPVADIIVGDRFRKDYGDIAALAKSISQFGLFHPLVLTRDGRLLAGGRRFSAIKSLSWATAPVHYIDEVDDILVREIELEENLLREDLTWQEEARLTKAIHDLKQQIYGQAAPGGQGQGVTLAETSPAETGWSIRRTAELVGGDKMTVHNSLRLAHALEVMPSLLKETSKTNALRALDRTIEDLERELERRQRDQAAYAAIESACVLGDAMELLCSLDTDSVDCIITDPPYGVDVGHGGGHRQEADFDDSPEAAMGLLRASLPQMCRVLKPTGHLYLFFSPTYWIQVFGLVAAAGFDAREVPCIWTKPGGATGTTDWDHNFAPSWEPFLFASGRQRRLNFKRKNVFTYAVDLGNARHHPTQKPIELIRELVQISTAPGELVLDPFAGSGTTLIAASQLRRKFLGYELSPRYHQIACKRIFEEGKERPYVSKPEI